MRYVTVALVMALVVPLALGQQQPPKREFRGPGPRKPEDCDMKKSEQAAFCKTCNAILEGQTLEDHKGKDYKAHEVGKRKVCVKKYFEAECHPENNSFEKGECCGKAKVEKISRTPLVWLCEGCSQTVDQEGGKCVFPDCPKKKLRQECQGQPAFPHTNEDNFRKKQKEKEKKEEKEKK